MVMPDVICVPNNNKSDTCAYHTIQSSRFSYYLFHYSMFLALFNREGFFFVEFSFASSLFFCAFIIIVVGVVFVNMLQYISIQRAVFMPFGWCFSCHHHRIREMMLFLNSHYCLYYYSFAFTSPLFPQTHPTSPLSLVYFSIVFVEQKGKI